MKYSVKSTVDVVKSHRLFLLKLLLAVQVGFLGYLLFSAIHDGHYFLAHEDEVINFCSAKIFSETGSLRAEGCIAEDVSRIGQMNWYGPAIPFCTVHCETCLATMWFCSSSFMVSLP